MQLRLLDRKAADVGASNHHRHRRGAAAIVRRAYLEGERRGAGEQQQQQAAAAAAPKNQLEALRAMSVVVADTGEPDLVAAFKPRDVTTNPSLIFKAAQRPEHDHLLRAALAAASRGAGSGDARFAAAADELSVAIGCEMLKLVPGRVSTEVDARLARDAAATYDRAMRLADLYAARGVDPAARVYIKLASTWEGAEACRRLEAAGVRVNMTLLFSFAQAAAAADAGAALASPFVGRILDWYKAKEGRDFAPHEDPGVLSVRRIYAHYKANKYPTTVMAASFRSAGEVRALAGVDALTVAPALLRELEAAPGGLARMLSPEAAAAEGARERGVDGGSRSWWEAAHGADQMAVDKLAEGIAGFAADQEKLEAQLAALAARM